MNIPTKSADPSAAPIATADAGPVGFASLPQAERPPLGALVAPDDAAALVAPDEDPAASPSRDAHDLDVPHPDAHGHDPADYRWVPVLRKPRADGWSPQKQRDFIGALADTGVVEEAARDVGMSVVSCYRLRRAPGARSFADAWDAAIQQASKALVDIAFDRAINGSDEPVFDKDGHRVGRRMRTNDRLLMFLLRAHLPERYGPDRYGLADRGGRVPVAPPSAAPVAAAIATLAPVEPDAPHLLMSPDDLAGAYQVANIMDGALPHWQRDAPVEPEPIESPLGEHFESMLEAAKREAAGPSRPRNDDDDDDDDR